MAACCVAAIRNPIIIQSSLIIIIDNMLVHLSQLSTLRHAANGSGTHTSAVVLQQASFYYLVEFSLTLTPCSSPHLPHPSPTSLSSSPHPPCSTYICRPHFLSFQPTSSLLFSHLPPRCFRRVDIGCVWT